LVPSKTGDTSVRNVSSKSTAITHPEKKGFSARFSVKRKKKSLLRYVGLGVYSKDDKTDEYVKGRYCTVMPPPKKKQQQKNGVGLPETGVSFYTEDIAPPDPPSCAYSNDKH